MPRNPKVSVIMSVYQEPVRWLRKSIDSIIAQTFKDWDLIILLDDPENQTLWKILQEYKQRDERVRIAKNKENLGLTRSLNKGLELARGEFIARMDGDDLAHPKRFEQQVGFLEKNPEVFLVGSAVRHINRQGEVAGTITPPHKHAEIKRVLEHKNCLVHPSIMFRNDGSRYREKFYYAQDYDFYLRALLDDKKLANMPEPLLKFRLSPTSISWSKKRQQVYFAHFARKFYHQQKELSTDGYEKFRPQEVLENKLFIPRVELAVLRKKLIHQLDVWGIGKKLPLR